MRGRWPCATAPTGILGLAPCRTAWGSSCWSVLSDGSALPILERQLAAAADRASEREGLAAHSAKLRQAWSQINATLDVLREVGRTSALDNATPFLRAFGHVVVAWLWLEQALVASSLAPASSEVGDFAQGKIRACRYFFEFEMPKVEAWLTAVGSRSDVAAGAPIESF
jgi:hypothetical protein